MGLSIYVSARMYRSLIPVFNSVKDQRKAHSCAKHKLITKNEIGVAGSGIWPLGMGNEVLKNGNWIQVMRVDF